MILRLTFNPGLALASFRTTRPWLLRSKIYAIMQNNIVPDDVIDVIWNAFPEITYGPRVAWVDAQRCVIKPVILVSLEEVRKTVGVSEDPVNRRRNTLPKVADWPRVARVDDMTAFVVAVVIRPQEEIDQPV